MTLAFRSVKGIMRYFSRVINSRGEATYRYGTAQNKMAQMGYEEYCQLLASENIFVRARPSRALGWRVSRARSPQ